MKRILLLLVLLISPSLLLAQAPVTIHGLDSSQNRVAVGVVGDALKTVYSDTAEELTPSLSIVTSSGTVSAGARFVSIALSDDFTGSILGQSISATNVASVTFAAPTGSTIGSIAYTRSTGSLTILALRPSE